METPEKFTPQGSTVPTAPDPLEDPEAVIEAAVLAWDERMPSENEGMLEASPPFYLEGDFTTEDRSDWRYADYTYSKDEIELDATETDVLSDLYLEMSIAAVVAMTLNLTDKKQNLRQWVLDVELEIEMSMMSQFMLGVGGRNVVNRSMIDQVKGFIGTQYGFFTEFAKQIRDGQLTVRGIAARAKMYAESSTEGYEGGKAAAHGIRLPAYPCDGSTLCLSNCRCHWQLVDVDQETVHAFWKLGTVRTEHCDDCVARTQNWNPYVAKRGE